MARVAKGDAAAGDTERERERALVAIAAEWQVGEGAVGRRKRIVDMGKVEGGRKGAGVEEDAVQPGVARQPGAESALPPLPSPAVVRRRERASQGVLRNAPAGAAVEFIPDLSAYTFLLVCTPLCVSQALCCSLQLFLRAAPRCRAIPHSRERDAGTSTALPRRCFHPPSTSFSFVARGTRS